MTTIAAGLAAYFYKNANALVLDGLQVAATGSFIDDLTGVTVTAALYSAGSDPDVATPISSSTISLAYIANSRGKWFGTFPSTVVVAIGDAIDAVITIGGNVSLATRWTLHCSVVARELP